MCCSIIGYAGEKVAAPILVQGLKRMEYRGYDSVGIATYQQKQQQSNNGAQVAKDKMRGNNTNHNSNNTDTILLRKGTGKVSEVNTSAKLDSMPGKTGIGHTRWATHGMVTKVNAHPHYSSSEGVAIVHNGIIKNYEEIKLDLVQEGYTFQSETDSEVIANLLQKNYDATNDIKESMLLTVARIQGEYAFVAMFKGGELAAARLREPLILGISDSDIFLSSDVLGFIEYTDEAVYVENGTIVTIDCGVKPKFDMLDFEGNRTGYEITKVSKEFGDAYKGDYAHFTEKEIYEQHKTITRAGEATRHEMVKAAAMISSAGSMYITGSGSSYNAALVAKHLLSKESKIGAEPIMASEMQFASEGIAPGSVLVAISQSGESADVLNAVKIAKDKGCKIISVVNMMTSSLVHASDVTIGMNCGPEIGVAATKSFTAQLAVFGKMIECIAAARGSPEHDTRVDGGGSSTRFLRISKSIQDALGDISAIQKVARDLKSVSDIYVLGRGVHYPIAVEAALKIKELTYIHAEGIAGGELKHGPLALMDSSAYVIIINPNDATYEETRTSAMEIGARGAKIIGISDSKSSVYDHHISIPKNNYSSKETADTLQYCISEMIPIQLLAYYTALEKDKDPDYPRNLAKSVTVR